MDKEVSMNFTENPQNTEKTTFVDSNEDNDLHFIYICGENRIKLKIS